MATEVKRLIQVRVDKGAKFKRDGYGKKRQLSDSWRKPRGQHNKQREQKKAKGALPKPGFGSPIAVRGMHPSGFFEVLVTSAKDLIGLDPKTQAVRIGGTVGDRKRVALQDAAIAAGLKVLNARTVKPKAAKAPAKAEARTEGTQKKAEKKSPASKTAPARKEAKKEKPAPKTEEKKAPAKKATAKPKAEVAAEKPVKKEKAPAKTAKAPVKPKEEKASGEAKPKAAAKAAAPATKAKKTTKSEVKKND
jgi:large subunit ribosomal protein L32e